MGGAGPPLRAAEWLAGADAAPAGLIALLDRIAVARDCAAGDVLVRQHERVRALIVLRAGRLSTLVRFAGVGDLVVESTEAPGRIFGWSGLRAPFRATATVRADRPSSVVTVPLAALEDATPAQVAALRTIVAGSLADRAVELACHRSDVREEADDA